MGDDKNRLPLRIVGHGRGTRKIQHGLFCNLKGVRIDARTRTGKWLSRLIQDLYEHLGGPDHVTVTQAIVIDGLASKCLRRHLYNLKFFEDKDPGSHAHILALENSIRLDCQSLGLEKQQKIPYGGPIPVSEVTVRFVPADGNGGLQIKG